MRYDKISTYYKLNIFVVIELAITGLLFNVCTGFVPRVQGYLIEAFEDSKPFKFVMQMALIYIGFILFVQLNRFLKRLFLRRFFNRMVLQMRYKAFYNLLERDINVFVSTKYGDIMNRQVQDIRDSASAIQTVTSEFFDSGVLLVSYFISMCLIDWKLACIVIIPPALSVIISTLLGHFVRKYSREFKEVYSDSKKENINVLQNEIYYRGFGVNQKYYDGYKDTLVALEKKATKNSIFRSSFEPLYLALAAIGYFPIFYFGGIKVFDSIWSIATFSAFLLSFTYIRKKCGFVGRILNNVQSGFVAWTRCKGFLYNDVNHKEVVPSDSGLRVKHLSFGFDDSFSVKDISFEAEKGDIIMICGRIRSGKTTLATALSGIYSYDGSIKLGDLELKDIRDDRVESFIHYAPGKVEIFNDTLKYNIDFAKPGDLDLAIDTAVLREDIDKFPSKEEEMLSHSLLNISGGQQRRLQIARSVYNSPRMVILDDPFNAIGHKMSIDIINNFKNNYKDTIFIIVNNQRDTLKMADKIIYLEDDKHYFNTYDNLMENDSFKRLMGGER